MSKNLVLVSHCDDETIFMAGTILSNPKDEWHVVSMVFNLEDSPRGIEFKNAMENYKRLGVNLTYQMLGHEDIELTPTDVEIWKESVKNLNLSPDAVYTHNS